MTEVEKFASTEIKNRSFILLFKDGKCTNIDINRTDCNEIEDYSSDNLDFALKSLYYDQDFVDAQVNIFFLDNSDYQGNYLLKSVSLGDIFMHNKDYCFHNVSPNNSSKSEYDLRYISKNDSDKPKDTDVFSAENATTKPSGKLLVQLTTTHTILKSLTI